MIEIFFANAVSLFTCEHKQRISMLCFLLMFLGFTLVVVLVSVAQFSAVVMDVDLQWLLLLLTPSVLLQLLLLLLTSSVLLQLLVLLTSVLLQLFLVLFNVLLLFVAIFLTEDVHSHIYVF